ncbi:EAL domain-containing protein [Oceanithermus sp.]
MLAVLKLPARYKKQARLFRNSLTLPGQKAKAERWLHRLEEEPCDVVNPQPYWRLALAAAREVTGAKAALLVSEKPRRRVLLSAGSVPEGADPAVVPEENRLPGELSSAGLPAWARRKGYEHCLVLDIAGERNEKLGSLELYFEGRVRVARWRQDFLRKVARHLSRRLQVWQAAERLRRMAFYDDLTGLPNRNLLIIYLNRLLSADEKDAWIAFLEVEDYSGISDIWGYDVADELLRRIASRLQLERANGLEAARCGTSRFALVGRGENPLEQVRKVIERLDRELITSQAGPRAQLRAGVVRLIHPAESAADIIRRGGMTLAEARSERKLVALYRPGMEAQLLDKRELVERLRSDLVWKRGLRLQYQPIIDLRRGKPFAVEALARWYDRKSQRWIPPAVFVPLAEQHGLGKLLDQRVVELAMEDASGWLDKLGGNAPRISINVSADSLTNDEFLTDLLKQLEGLPKNSRPLFEMTERVLADTGRTSEIIERLHGAGALVLVDDFGTGYSSLAYLAEMEVDAFKLDRSLLAGVQDNPRARAVMRAALDLGRELNLPAIVEGVENQGQLAWLRSQGCRYAQGFFLGRPVSAGGVVELVRAG